MTGSRYYIIRAGRCLSVLIKNQMESILAILSPVAIVWATVVAKQIYLIRLSPFRVIAVRALVGVFAFGAAFGTAWLNGEPFDPASVETAVATVLNFLAATGFYLITRDK